MEISRRRIGALQVGIGVLALATAFIHLSLAVTTVGDIMTTIMFTLNFLGYVTLLAAYLLPLPILRRYHNVIRYLFIGFATLTIILWAIMGMRITLGYIDKTIEVLLVVLLLLDR